MHGTWCSQSHNAEYPTDSWNLYCLLDSASTVLNIDVSSNPTPLTIFKPFERRLDPNPFIISDADEEILISVRFIAPSNIRKIMIIGHGPVGNHPSRLKCYVNKENIDFTNIGDIRPSQEFTLPVNERGDIELLTQINQFTNVNTLVLYFPTNYGADNTAVQYIGLQGDHSHAKREAVIATYELIDSRVGSKLTGEFSPSNILG